MRMSKLLLVCFAVLIFAMGCSKSGEKATETAEAPMTKTETTTAAPATAAIVEEVTLAVTGMT